MITDPFWMIGATLVGYVLVVKIFRWLDPLAYIGAIFLAFSIWFCLENEYLVYPILFLVVGSILSKIFKTDDSNGRKATQVIANGGVACLLAWLYYIDPKEIYSFLLVLSMAVANSDTVSSVIGAYVKGKTYDITTLSRVKPGMSGGISIVGTIAGILGAAMIGAVAYTFSGSSTELYQLTLWGSIGMVIDSILGSLLQAKYQVNGSIVERGDRSQLVKGLHFMNNDVVNFTSIALTCALFYIYEVI